MIKTEVLIDLLGKQIDSNEFKNFSARILGADISEIEGTWYYSYENFGLEIQFEDNILNTIQFFADGVDDYKQYPYSLPHKISFSCLRKEIQEILGKPFKKAQLYDVYQYDNYVMHIEYAGKTKKISLVTLMTHETFSELQ